MATLLQQIRMRSKPVPSTGEVGEFAGVDQTTYWRIEQGRTTVDLSTAERIAKFFDVPMHVIFSPSRYTAAAEESGIQEVAELEAKAS